MTQLIDKQILHDIGAVLDFREKTITIDGILWPTRNIVNLQVKPSVTQEPISTQKATKRFIGILDAKYDKAEIPEIVRTSCPHLTPSEQDMLLSLLLDYDFSVYGLVIKHKYHKNNTICIPQLRRIK